MRTRRAAVLCLCAAACTYNPRFEDGKTRCSPEGECPPGFTCGSDQLCRRPSAGDASAADTAPATLSPDGPPADGPGLTDAASPPDTAIDAAPAPPDTSLPPDMSLMPVDVPPDVTAPRDQREVPCAEASECQGQTGFACVGNSVVRCEPDEHGCLGIRSQTACQAGSVCSGQPPNAACRN